MRRKIFALVLAIAMVAGLGAPALAADLTDEEAQDMMSVTYDVDGTKINIRNGIEVEETVTYLRLEDHSKQNILDTDYKRDLETVSTTESSYLAIRDGSVFEVSLSKGNVASSSSGMLNTDTFIVIYATPYLQNDSGVYEPEYICRQCLTSRGFVDENLEPNGVTLVIAGYPAQFKLPISAFSLLGKQKTDVLYGFELDLFQENPDGSWNIHKTYFIAKIDEAAVDAYLSGEKSGNDTPSTPTQTGSVSATPTSSTVLVNGKNTAFDAYNINGSNYFKLRDLAYVLNGTEKQFEVGWDNAAKAISLTSGAAYTPAGGEMTGKGSGTQTAPPSSAKIIVDGKEVSLTAYNIGGNNYFKLRDIGETFNFGIGWDNTSKTITIDTSTGYTA